ncbi:hypothetical protein HG535_0D06130 [Zygotorulaspora mrakii]|uniref:Rho-GAP domain-containing protein n=1 Tax=Zygotorulaspora mrakii TaxID=42260 RepID=A0A7H9B3D2_ZYGMR|nr:uncharacterized protein HG535_0D06130 [Zygotorulaspora mrakii]QLG72904.1 hypothetical protein HG535_0D06130 [Zygotorulaspora mrakii]
MPIFADSFWTADYTTGLNVLFEKLYDGCEECDMFIQVFASRMQYEVSYGRQLGSIKSGIDHVDRIDDDPEVTTTTALKELIKQTSNEGSQHLAIASNIEAMALQPFSKWCNDHRKRIEYSEKTLKSNVNNFHKSKKYVSKLEQEYLNKCRQLEDFKLSNFNDEELAAAMEGLKLQKKYEKDIAREQEFQHFGSVGGIAFDFKSMRETLQLLLTKLPKNEYKVPLINFTLQNTNSGGEITKFILENMSLKDIDQAETFGQDLLDLGFLKYCNGVGNTFVNSKKFQYQWKTGAYKFANVAQPFADSESNLPQMEPKISNYIQDFASKISSAPSNSSGHSTPSAITAPAISESEKTLLKMLKDMENYDNRYRHECSKMDLLRCSIEELIVDHLSFMEKCEMDRLKAIKKVTFDFLGAVGNKISALKICIDAMLERESKMDPAADLLHLLSKYRTGVFKPRVLNYNNYYNPGAFQNFGIDLETRCRLDKRMVPSIVTLILSYMDGIYPELASDNVRTAVWIAPVKLSLTHQLRQLLNKGQSNDEKEVISILKQHDNEPSIVASVLKIYLLELPEPLISNDIYDILKVLYAEYSLKPSLSTEEAASSKEKSEDNNEDLINETETNRITGLSATLSSLPKPHIATLDAIISHFYRLIKILKIGENGDEVAVEFTSEISKEFANCIIEVRMPDGNDLGYRIFYDLLTHRKQVFGELKRQGSKSRGGST